MSLKSLREKYLSGSISKLDYVSEVQSVLSALEDIGEFMKNTDLKSIKILTGGGA